MRRDGACLVDQKGSPFYIVGDAAWSLIVRLTDDEVEHYLAARQARGFNTVIVELIEHKFGGPKDRDGEAPFVIAGDFATPNEAYFAHADRVLRNAAEHGMLVLLTPVYLGYEGGDEGWYQELVANGVEKARGFGRYLGTRYRDFANIVWVEGGDTPPMAAATVVDALVAGIKESDPAHLHTAHSRRHRSAVDDYQRPWLDLNASYVDCSDAEARLRLDYLRSRTLPFFLVEGTYENEAASMACLATQAYASLLLGARGHVFGNRPMWLFDPGWEPALDSPGTRIMEGLAALLAARDLATLVPDTGHAVVTGALAARTAMGSTVLVLVPGAATRVSVDTGHGARRAWWLDTATGRAVDGGSFPEGGRRDLTSPAEGGPWLLVVDDATRGLPPP